MTFYVLNVRDENGRVVGFYRRGLFTTVKTLATHYPNPSSYKRAIAQGKLRYPQHTFFPVEWNGGRP